MARLLTCFALLAFLAAPAFAGDPVEKKKEAKKAPPPIATPEELSEAFKTFKTEFKAKGLKGEEKIGAKVWAIKTLAHTQHKKVVDELAKLTRNRDQDVRTAAVQYLGMQRALSGYAGAKLLAAMKKHSNDSIVQISGLQAIQDLDYRACEDLLRSLMKHSDYAVQKSAMFAIGEMKDIRLLNDVYLMLKKLKLAKGDSWDGVSVTHDTGTAGDHDQREAERIGRAQMKKNERKGRGGARSQRDLGPVVEEVMKSLTGEEFSKEKEARDWLKANEKVIAEQQGAINDIAKQQVAAAKKTR